MVNKYSTDPTAKQNAGYLNVFPAGMMIKQFSDATKALKPGDISQPVETSFGYHIIQRMPYAKVQKEFAQSYGSVAKQIADSSFIAKLDAEAGIQVKDNAPSMMKEAAREAPKHRTDKGVLATFKGGELTVADYLGWVDAAPPQQQLLQRIPDAPDSALKPFAKQLAQQQVLLSRAEAAKIDIPAEMKTNLYGSVGQLVQQIWTAMGVDPKMLADSAKNTAEKERLAAARVDAYLDRMMAGQAQVLTFPVPLKKMLDAKYESSVNAQGVDRATERAQKVRASVDSTRAANQPKSAVPMPGMGAPPAGARPPEPQPQQPATPPTGTKKP
jgi:peptidyl-prolyl cis-trans isomerase D